MMRLFLKLGINYSFKKKAVSIVVPSHFWDSWNRKNENDLLKSKVGGGEIFSRR